jgi:hypothetical protein
MERRWKRNGVEMEEGVVEIDEAWRGDGRGMEMRWKR